MFYRRKIILSVLQLFGGEMEKLRFQKLLFLFTRGQQNRVYDFVPYKFGCFSLSANADITAMVRHGLLDETETKVMSKTNTDYFAEISEHDRAKLTGLKKQFAQLSTNHLIRYTYLNYPYYGIRSEIAANMLTTDELEKMLRSKPVNNDTVLFTIGYEGISPETYLNRLLINDVKLLVDVRRNPLSMKYGFSKTQLSKFCESLGIKYMHIPELGIKSELRRQLNTQEDYNRLFKEYHSTTLVATQDLQEHLLDLLKKHRRIALTCFEANIHQCHRKHLADSVSTLSGFQYRLKHI
jgi:uncharacterized protein (DUF488 family)